MGGVLYLHPFAEEMNKSRRVAAEQARALSVSGWDVLQIDLAGCGDSTEDFEQATWDVWRADAMLAYAWLRARVTGPIVLWSLRAGCLLATEVANRIAEGVDLVLWQPVLSGRQYFQQVLRLKLVSERLGEDNERRTSVGVRQELAQAGSLEIGGYAISEALAAGLEGAELRAASQLRSVYWIEVSPQEAAELAPAATRCIEAWRQQGFHVEAAKVRGPQFWQTTEIEDCPALIVQTCAFLSNVRR
jgi:exosortase A-associated hydrolase 2